MAGARVYASIAAAVAVGALTPLLATAGPADGTQCEPDLRILTTSQAKILKRGAIRVRASGDDCAAGQQAKLGAKSRIKGKTRRIAEGEWTTLGDSGLVELALTRRGEQRIERCRRQTLIVLARAAEARSSDRAALKRNRCGGDGGGGGGGGGNGSGGGPGPGQGNGPEPAGIDTSNSDRCDFLDPAHCLYPWPNDHFTARDDATATGRRIDLRNPSMPRNRAGVPINAADYNRNDGFSPGNMVITKVPGLESQAAFDATGAVPITDIGSYADRGQPIVVINARTGERHPIWSEIDSNPADPEDVTLLIRPAVNFEEGGRYIVALRNLRRANGKEIEAQRAFRLYRDDIKTRNEAVERRRQHFERLFRTLGDAGIGRRSLYLAWDFTVASERNLSERALHMRDDAFAQLGDTNLADMQVAGSSPTYLVTEITDYGPCGGDGCAEPNPITGTGGEDDGIARQVEGQIVVPCYTNQPGCPTGSQFAFAGGANTPQRLPGNTTTANFICRIPRSAIDGAPNPARPSLYGHGLLGSASEVGGGNIGAMANEHNMLFCATDWVGFSTGDLPTVATILQDLSNFPKMADRTQQGFLNFMFLGRAMIHPEGFSAHPAFQAGGQSVLDTGRLFYDGNSQGGILGGSLTALAPDFDRAVLGVPGMNYSTLLRRSVDFDLYAKGEFGQVVCDEAGFIDPACAQLPPGVLDPPAGGLYDAYPNELERPLILSLIQMLWDRGEANGYAHHMTSDPLPNTPPHDALLHVAFGDHQVAQVTAEVEARTIGAVTNANPLDPGRHSDTEPLWNIPRVDFSTPYDGSALVYWDSGSPTPPTANIPPREGQDPHSHPRNDVKARQQKAAFLSVDGKVTEVCGGGPCYANGYTGAP